jgi:hypothetical protein
MDMLGIKDEPSEENSKEAAYDPDRDNPDDTGMDPEDENRGSVLDTDSEEPDGGPEKYEKPKTQKFVGQGHVPPEIAAQINTMFKAVVERYFPSSYFDREGYAKNSADTFYQMAYRGFLKKIQKDMSDRLKDYGIPGANIQLNPEVLYDIILDSLTWLHQHPSEIKLGLINAVSSAESAEELPENESPDEEERIDTKLLTPEEQKVKEKKEKEEEKKPLGEAQAFFKPRYDEGEFNTRIEQGEDVGKASPRKIDLDVVNNLRGRYEIKWRWKDMVEGKILHFTLPELYGDRVFTIQVPSAIRDISPGEYTFRIKSVKEGRGAIVEFIEQKVKLHEDKLKMIRTPRKGGLGPDQLKKFIDNGIIGKYRMYLWKMPIGELIQKYSGLMTIGGNQIGSVSDLEELSGLGEESTYQSKGRGGEEVRALKQESVEAERAKIDALITRWSNSPEVAQRILQVPEEDGSRITQMIASKFPFMSDKNSPSFPSIMATQPVVAMVLSHIMSPTTPLTGGGKASPWIHLALDEFGEMALSESSVRNSVVKMIQYNRKDAPGSDLPVTDEEITSFVNLSKKAISNKLGELIKQIGQVIESNRHAPELQKFFDRRRVFREYSGRILEDEISDFIEENNLDINNPGDIKEIEKYYSTRLNRLIQSLEKKRPFKRKKEQDKEDAMRTEKKRVRDEQKQQAIPALREERQSPQDQPIINKQSSDSINRLIHQLMIRMSA